MNVVTEASDIVIADDDEAVRLVLAEFVSQLGHHPIATTNGLEALDAVAEARAAVLMSDVMMPIMDGLELLRKVKARHSSVKVALFSGFANERVLIDALRADADDFFKKPFTLQTVRQSLQRLRPVITPGSEAWRGLVWEEARWRIPNDPDLIQTVVPALTRSAGHRLDPDRHRGLRVALTEVILNAVEHGNLAITWTQKTEALEKGQYAELIQNRRKHPGCRNRTVDIQYRLEAGQLTWTVSDQGAGFNWRAWFEPETTVNLSSHGRGLALAAHYLDRLTFNQTGNQATLVMYENQKE
jgi:CheY-like chemotaxis protein/anti-sigma regulatory factor (Ser/Thr protein kinase)